MPRVVRWRFVICGSVRLEVVVEVAGRIEMWWMFRSGVGVDEGVGLRLEGRGEEV